MKKVKEIEKMLEVYEQTGSIRQTAKILHCSKNTVKCWIHKSRKQPDVPLELMAKRKKTKLGFKSISPLIEKKIIQQLEENKEKHIHLKLKNAKILTKLHQEGISISKSSVQRIVSSWRKQNDPHKEIFIQQVPTVGPACEFDWGYIHLNIRGLALRLSAVFIVLRGSLYRYARIYPRETSQFVIQAHMDYFHHIGGVPDIIRYDNLKTVISDPVKKTVNPSFLRFATHYGFQVNACNRQSPEEKGTDEESVGFLRNWVYCLRDSFSSLQEANDYLENELIPLNSRSVFRREETPVQALQQNIDQLHAYPSLQYDNSLQEVRHINKYNQISVEANWYSVPEEYRRPTIGIKLYPERLELWDFGQDTMLASHPRIFEKGHSSINLFHYLKTLRQKSRALVGSVALHQAHQTLQRLYSKYYQQKPKEFVDLLFLFREYPDLDHVIQVLESVMQQGLLPSRELLLNVLQQSEDPPPIPFSYDKVPSQVILPDFHVYDQMIQEGGNHG